MPITQCCSASMDARRAASMQMQIKHNAEDLQNFMNGLESWEEDIKEKDLNLSRQKPILKEVGGSVMLVMATAPHHFNTLT